MITHPIILWAERRGIFSRTRNETGAVNLSDLMGDLHPTQEWVSSIYAGQSRLVTNDVDLDCQLDRASLSLMQIFNTITGIMNGRGFDNKYWSEKYHSAFGIAFNHMWIAEIYDNIQFSPYLRTERISSRQAEELLIEMKDATSRFSEYAERMKTFLGQVLLPALEEYREAYIADNTNQKTKLNDLLTKLNSKKKSFLDILSEQTVKSQINALQSNIDEYEGFVEEVIDAKDEANGIINAMEVLRSDLEIKAKKFILLPGGFQK